MEVHKLSLPWDSKSRPWTVVLRGAERLWRRSPMTTTEWSLVNAVGINNPELSFTLVDAPAGPECRIKKASPQLWIDMTAWGYLVTFAGRGYFEHDPEHDTITLRDADSRRTVVYRLRRDLTVPSANGMLIMMEWPD